MLRGLLVSIHRGRKIAFIYLRDVSEELVRPEPAKLTYRYANSECIVELTFLSGHRLVFSLVDADRVLETCDDIMLELYTGRALYRYKSCYKLGNVWYIDYIGSR